MTTRRLFVAAAALMALPATAAASERTLSGSAPAGALREIAIDAGRSSVSVAAGDVDVVTWRVTLRPAPDTAQTIGRAIRDWFFRPRYATEAELIAAVRARATTRGDVLDLSLEPATAGRRDRIHEQWTVIVPARMAARLTIAEGDGAVTGLSGGVRVDMGVGEVRVDAPSGDIAIDAGVGDVTIHYGSTSLRSIYLATDVGETAYSVSGLNGGHRAPPGAGDRISINGRGQHQIRATVDVGDVSLDVN